jgi:hypothetical protein
MPIQNNTFFKAIDFDSQIVKIIDNLLKSYPLTKKLSSVIGKPLLDNVELGFFSSGFEIIKQGETGKDVFFHCNNEVDVIVNDQAICKMQAPGLIGDKGIVSQDAIRSASIVVSEDNTCLFLKIPMDIFLRSYKDISIPDEDFAQEKEIYFQLFTEIQQRLFKYAFLQRQIWEEVSLLLKNLNTQLIVGIFEKKKEVEWKDETWTILKAFLAKNYKFVWPAEIPINAGTYRDILYSILGKVFPATKFSGPEDVYLRKKQQLWVNWLNKTSALVIKTLSNDQLPVNIGGIGLFDPRNYQGRVQAMLSSIEQKFMFKKVKLKGNEEHVESLKVKNFFGKEIDSNQFNLKEYLTVFEELFELKRPNRLLAQVAQQAARVTAKSENEFNDSVSRMQQFITRVQNLSMVEEKTEVDVNKLNAFLNSIQTIKTGLKSYNKKIVGMTQNFIGETRFTANITPKIIDIAKSVSVQQIRSNLIKSLNQIINHFGMTQANVSKTALAQFLFISESVSGDIIPQREIDQHYWIPISSSAGFYLNNELQGEIEPGTIIGGENWKILSNHEGIAAESYTLKTPKVLPGSPNYEFIYFTIPKDLAVWNRKAKSFDTNFDEMTLPLAQWIVSSHIRQIRQKHKDCKFLFKKYAKVVEVLETEGKIREFESSQYVIPEKIQKKINNKINNSVGISFPYKEDLTSEKLSKHLYITILKQTKRFYKNLSIEEQNNKAYTLWRFVQSEIIQFIPHKPFVKPSVPKILNSDISQRLLSVFEKHGLTLRTESETYILIPEIDLIETFSQNTGYDYGQKLAIIAEVMKILEIENHLILTNALAYRKQLSKIENVNLDINYDKLQSEFILESIIKLQNLLNQHFEKESESLEN